MTSVQTTTAGKPTTLPPTKTTPAPARTTPPPVLTTTNRASPKPTATKPTPAKPTPAKPTPAPTTTAKPQVVTVTAVEAEYTISLSSTTFRPGQVTFVVENKGTMTHALGVHGPGVDTTTDDLAKGSSARLTVTLAKGTYDLYCPIADHQSLGMDVHITVA